jgi:hypothetical protein
MHGYRVLRRAKSMDRSVQPLPIGDPWAQPAHKQAQSGH